MRHVKALQSSNQLACSRATSTRTAHLVSQSGKDRSEGSVPRLAGSGLFYPATAAQFHGLSAVTLVTCSQHGPVNMPVPA